MKNPAHDISRNLHAKPEANEPPGAEKLHDQSGRDAATDKAVPADPAAAPLGAGVAGKGRCPVVQPERSDRAGFGRDSPRGGAFHPARTGVMLHRPMEFRICGSNFRP